LIHCDDSARLGRAERKIVFYRPCPGLVVPGWVINGSAVCQLECLTVSAGKSSIGGHSKLEELTLMTEPGRAPPVLAVGSSAVKLFTRCSAKSHDRICTLARYPYEYILRLITGISADLAQHLCFSFCLPRSLVLVLLDRMGIVIVDIFSEVELARFVYPAGLIGHVYWQR